MTATVTPIRPVIVPARSPIGVALGVVLALTLMSVGVVAGLSTPTINGARLLALLAVAVGGAMLVRITRLAR